VTQRTEVEQRRAIEDEAITLGERRRALQDELHENARAIGALAERATAAGVGLAPLSRLLGISRQGLYGMKSAKEMKR
jgi:hypothetical protein